MFSISLQPITAMRLPPSSKEAYLEVSLQKRGQISRDIA